MKKILLYLIALTIQLEAVPELKFMPGQAKQIYSTIKDHPELTIKIKEARGAIQQMEIKEIIVGLHRSEDGKMVPNRFFAVTDEGAVIVLQKISGHKIITELEPQITKIPKSL